MAENLWEAERELMEPEARSLTPEQVNFRRGRILARGDVHHQRWLAEGAILRHISETPLSVMGSGYEFVWVFPDKTESNRSR